MSLPDLLLGTRRLNREINSQSQQLKHDIEHVKFATAQLRHTAAAKVTSPLGLLSAAGIGFLVGKKATARPSYSKEKQPKEHPRTQQSGPHHNTIGHIAALALDTTRSLGIQILLPIAITWAQTKFDDYANRGKKKDKTATDTTKVDSSTTTRNYPPS